MSIRRATDEEIEQTIALLQFPGEELRAGITTGAAVAVVRSLAQERDEVERIVAQAVAEAIIPAVLARLCALTVEQGLKKFLDTPLFPSGGIVDRSAPLFGDQGPEATT